MRGPRFEKLTRKKCLASAYMINKLFGVVRVSLPAKTVGSNIVLKGLGELASIFEGPSHREVKMETIHVAQL